jgi:hypothetical protein
MKPVKDTKSIGLTVFVLLKSVMEAKLKICESAGMKIEKVVPSSAVLASCFESLPQQTQKQTMAFCYAVGGTSEFASFSRSQFCQVQELASASEEELWEDLQRETNIFRSQAQVPDDAPLDLFLFSPMHRIWERETQDQLLKIHPIRNLTQLGFSRGKTTLDAKDVNGEFLPAMAALTSFKRRNPYSINLLPAEKRSAKSPRLWVPACAGGSQLDASAGAGLAKADSAGCFRAACSRRSADWNPRSENQQVEARSILAETSRSVTNFKVNGGQRWALNEPRFEK